MIQVKNIIKLVFLTTLMLFSEVDMQTAVYDGADEMIRFDEKMNRMIDEHNAQIFEDEDMQVFENRVEDFEELENGYLLERTINDSNNTKVELSLNDRKLTILTEVTKKEKIVENDITSYETTTTNSSVSLFLPNDADEKSMEDTYKNGILKIKFRKK